ncbi:MAG: succinyl-diaminopimelate desuccinylase [Actinomycetes bacterium]
MLDLHADLADLTAALIDIPSVSGEEAALADAIEEALREQAPHLTIIRDGNSIIARTELGRPSRVVLAGHIDTVPIADNVPSTVEGERLYGCGATDMKSGVAIQLHLAVTLTDPRADLTFFFYECEEVEAARNGLARIAQNSSEQLEADFAILLEPTNGLVEGGCQGTMRAEVTVRGVRAHSARAWLGENAIHEAHEILTSLAEYEAERVMVDGLEYREGLQAVAIKGGVAGNVIPDELVVTVNYRFAPSKSEADAERFLRRFFDGYALTIVDRAPGALPGLNVPIAQDFIAAVGEPPAPKFGWTDVARFSALGIPAVNYGPGNPALAHTEDENVDIALIYEGASTLLKWLS